MFRKHIDWVVGIANNSKFYFSKLRKTITFRLSNQMNFAETVIVTWGFLPFRHLEVTGDIRRVADTPEAIIKILNS